MLKKISLVSFYTIMYIYKDLLSTTLSEVKNKLQIKLLKIYFF